MAKPQLFLLPFAGGDGNSFQFLRKYLAEFEFIPLELPGRGKRMKEKLLVDFAAASDDFLRQIMRCVRPDCFLIYGHSMGSLLALSVAEKLELQGVDPLQLIVSGNPGPGDWKELILYKLSKEELRRELVVMGGIPEEIISNNDIFDFFEPILRSDFEIVERLDWMKLRPVKAPIYAIMGSKEENIQHIGNWEKYTSSGFDARVLEGDHFFIIKQQRKIAEIISDSFRASYTKRASRSYHDSRK